MSLASLFSLPRFILQKPVRLLPGRTDRLYAVPRGGTAPDGETATADRPSKVHLRLLPDIGALGSYEDADRPEAKLRPHRRGPLTSYEVPDPECSMEWVWRPRARSSPFDAVKGRKKQRLELEAQGRLRRIAARSRVTSSASRRPHT
jgi:hypothetical protein